MPGRQEDDSSSEDECLASLKRKAEISDGEGDKRSRGDGLGDEDGLIPGVFVKVEVEELDEETSPLDYSTTSTEKEPDITKCMSKSNISKNWKTAKKKKSVKCPECRILFESATELRKHALSHQIETRHKCDECGRCFTKAFGLRTHKRMHGEKNIKCPLCDAMFTLQINLGRHMLYHEKPERCDKCEEHFYTRDQLDDHVCDPHKEKPKKRRRRNYKEPLVYNKPEPETPFKIASRTPLEFKISLQPSSSQMKTEDTDEESDHDKQNGFELITRREDVTYPTQCAIVSKMHKGRPVADICQIYNLTADVVSEIWEDREAFVILKKAGRKSIKYMNSVLDARILEWFNTQKTNNVQVSGKMLMDIAEAFAKETGFVAFNGSKKWLDRFKTRYRICFRSTPTKRDYNIMPSESKWKNLFLKEQWQDVRHGLKDEEIYTADEVGLYYNPSRGRIRKLAGKKYIHGLPKDRVAIFLCTNVTGSDKKKLLVCGTEDPLVHSFRSPETLPVTYIRHAQGHFTTPMFEEFVKFWNRQLQFQNKRAVLILDRATIHSKLTLSNLKLVFVPWKATNSLMPIKTGIFTAFRDQFRKLILQDKTMNALRGVDRNLTCLEALNMMQKAWERTPSDIITRCFEQTGYDIDNNYVPKIVDVPKITDNDDELMVKILDEYDVEPYYLNLGCLDQYLTVDEEFLMGHGTNGSVFGGNHKSHDADLQNQKEIAELMPIATERPETDEIEDSMVKTRAAEDLEIVRRYLQTNGATYDTYCQFLDIEKFLVKKNPLRL